MRYRDLRIVLLTVFLAALAGCKNSVDLEVQIDGAGSVISSVGDIDCGNGSTACKASLDTDTEITLTATSEEGFVFHQWQRLCAEEDVCAFTCTTDNVCTLSLSESMVLNATFLSESGDIEAPSAVTTFYGSVATLSSVELGIGKAIDNLAPASALKYEVFVSTDKTLLFDNASVVAVLDGAPDGGELTYEVNDLTSGVEYFFGVIAVDPAFNKSSPATISSFYLPTELCEIASFEHFVEWEGFTLTDLSDNQYTYTMTNNAISPSVGDIIVKRIDAPDDQPHDIQNDTHILIRINAITGNVVSGEEVFWGQLITNDCSIVVATGDGVASIAAELPQAKTSFLNAEANACGGPVGKGSFTTDPVFVPNYQWKTSIDTLFGHSIDFCNNHNENGDCPPGQGYVLLGGDLSITAEAVLTLENQECFDESFDKNFTPITAPLKIPKGLGALSNFGFAGEMTLNYGIHFTAHAEAEAEAKLTKKIKIEFPSIEFGLEGNFETPFFEVGDIDITQEGDDQELLNLKAGFDINIAATPFLNLVIDAKVFSVDYSADIKIQIDTDTDIEPITPNNVLDTYIKTNDISYEIACSHTLAGSFLLIGGEPIPKEDVAFCSKEKTMLYEIPSKPLLGTPPIPYAWSCSEAQETAHVFSFFELVDTLDIRFHKLYVHHVTPGPLGEVGEYLHMEFTKYNENSPGAADHWAYVVTELDQNGDPEKHVEFGTKSQFWSTYSELKTLLNQQHGLFTNPNLMYRIKFTAPFILNAGSYRLGWVDDLGFHPLAEAEAYEYEVTNCEDF